MAVIRACLCTFLCLAAVAHGAKVTPMEKVITLLKDLSTKVAEEGKKEAAQYDKFACFCKEQADEKLYSIEKSDAKIADLAAEQKELDAAIAALNSEISKLSKLISERETKIEKMTEKRAKEHAEYEAKAKDMNEAIDACAAAIEALKDSKASMKGAKVDFIQVTDGLAKVVAKQPLLASAPGAVTLLSQIKKGAPKFEYQSNDIIATLEDLLASFKASKKDLDIEEFDVNSAFESNKLGLSNDKKFAEKAKAEKDAIVEEKTEHMNAVKADKDQETKDKDADQAFLDEITKECEEKAKMFDQRSSTRADELTALHDATAKLEEGAVPNFEANKKLVGFQQKASLGRATPISASQASFVQIASVQHQRSAQHAALDRVRKYLVGAADRIDSRAISALSMRVQVAEDHFVKVRGLIKDLIAKLKDDAKSEATQKKMCDKGMSKAISDRDTANSKIEVANAKITTLTAKKESLLDEIDTLNEGIAELKKALLEATELREKEKAENEKTIDMAKQGAEATTLALGILKEFYNNAFLQTKKYVPPKSDRDGNTVGDLAPDVFGEDYHGSQSESKGIVGILEVILSDFDRTVSTTESDEKEAKQAFEKFESDTNSDVGEKDDAIKKAKGDLSDTKAAILEQQDALADGKELLESALSELEDLESMCVKGEETWEERKKKREEEIEALKEALAILEESTADID